MSPVMKGGKCYSLKKDLHLFITGRQDNQCKDTTRVKPKVNIDKSLVVFLFIII